ncbi:MAG: hypothetical protein J4203_02750 [Candidatus Diapherotrites archaeon]|uniref:KaiC domain-containing protein n=1 Tax=Candidatus Iainarchaeum sp. TaxID=3101447 RepID=A0A8T4LIP9_9ARCH|nr:hypothetical protein [Candidatus Diapherotrites archaeon]
MPFGIKFKGEEKITPRKELLPMRIDNFDKLLEKGGVERGSTLMVAGGCGAGKSTFCMDSVYHSILEGERAVYITFEEQASKLRKHMLENFNWDMDKLEKENKFALIRSDPFKIARSVEAFLAERKGDLLVEVQEIQLPFTPDRIIIDSLSALSVAFMGNVENYRYYIRYMFEMLEKYDSVNYIISETTSDPGVYSRSGIEEFLSDGVIVLYNKLVGNRRERSLEILKMRCCDHVKQLVPFKLVSGKGVSIELSKEVREEIAGWK